MHARTILVSLAVILVTAVLVAVILRPEPKEPEYRGKKLSYWIDKSTGSLADDGDPEAIAAVRQIGTNSIPCLLKWIRSENQLWNKLTRTVYRLPNFPRRTALLQEFGKRSSAGFQMASRGRAGFHILGRQAVVAIPELSEIVRHSSSPASAKWAARSLASLGKDALPPLIEVVSNRKQGPSNRYDAAYAISLMTYLDEEAIPSLPTLAQCLGETNKLLSDMCAKGLGNFARAYSIMGCGPPGFPQFARSPNWKVRLAAVRAIADAGIANKQVVTILLDAAKDSDARVSAEAVAALQGIAPKMHKSIPLLTSSLNDTSVTTAYDAAETMGVFLIEPERCVPALSRAAGSTNWQVRSIAICALGKFGPAAKPASDVIFNALNDRESTVRSSATNAMRLIEPKRLRNS